MDIFSTKPSKLLAGSKLYVQGIKSRIDGLTFKGEDFRVHIGNAVILDAPLNRTIEGASTLKLTLHDREGDLRTSKLLLSKFDVKIDDLWFRYTGMTRQDRDTLILTFQARNVDRLRLAPGALKGKRGTYTRAEFWASQAVNEVKGPRIPLWIPELHDVQPIETASQDKAAKTATGVTRGKGLDTSANLEVKGIAANAEQLQNGDTCLRVGASLNAPEAAMLAVIMAGTQENNMTNSDQGTGCLNYFCFISQTASSFSGDYKDLAQTAHSFFVDGFGAGKGAIDYANEGMSPGDICANIENPAEQYRGLYAQWQPQAEKWLAAFGGAVGGLSVTSSKDYSFERKANETIWANGTRLFEEVNWRFFEAAGVIYVITEPELLSSKVRMHVSDDAPGVESITYDYLVGKAEDQITVTCRAKQWAAPPGTVAVVHDQGPVDGRYLVSSIDSNLLAATDLITITLKRPQKPLPEPAPETSTKSVGGSSTGSDDSTESSTEAGVGTYDGKQVAKWIIPWLEKSKEAGWGGTVTSGYRTPEYSTQLCISMCGQPSCPGTCAGATSNHSGDKYPEGAVDVSDPSTFASVQTKIGSPLKNDLPADPVHFSVSGH